MSFIFKGCKHKKRKKARIMHPICDVVRSVESDISIKSIRTISGTDEPTSIEGSSLENGVNECPRQNAENEDSSLSVESDFKNREVPSSEQDTISSGSSRLQQVDSLNNVKTLLSYTVLISSSDMEGDSKSNRQSSSDPFNANSDKMGNDVEESGGTDTHEIPAETLKVSDVSRELADTVLQFASDMEDRSKSNRHRSSESFNGISDKMGNVDEESGGTNTHEKLAETLKVSDDLADTVLQFACDMEEERSRSNRHSSSESFNGISDEMGNDGEESRDTNTHEELAETLKPSDIAIDLEHADMYLKCTDPGSLTELREFEPVKETTAEIEKIVCKNKIQNEELDEEQIGIIDSQKYISTDIDNVKRIRNVDNELSEMFKNSSNFVVSEVTSEHDIITASIVSNGVVQKEELEDHNKGLNYLCTQSTKGSEGDIEMYSGLLSEKMQKSPDQDIQKHISNDECNDNFSASVNSSHSLENICYGLTDKFEEDARKNIGDNGHYLKKETKQKEIDNPNSTNNTSQQSVNFLVATGIINQVVGDLLCGKPQDASKAQFEESSTNNLDCCGDWVSAIPDYSALKEIPCGLAAVLGNDPIQTSFNISGSKRFPNVLNNSLEHQSLSPDIKTNGNNESLKGDNGESENPIDNKIVLNIKTTSELSDSGTESTALQHEEFVGIVLAQEENDIKRNTSSPIIHSLYRDSLLSNIIESSMEHEPLEYSVEDASSLLLTNTILNRDAAISPKRKYSNDHVETILHEKNVGCTHGDGENEKRIKMALNEHLFSNTDEKKTAVTFELHQISNFEKLSENENLQMEEIFSFENELSDQSDSESTIIMGDNTEFHKVRKYAINREAIRVQVRKIIVKAVDLLQMVISLSREESKTKLEPISRNTVNKNWKREVKKSLSTSSGKSTSISYFLNEYTNRLMKNGYFNDTNGNFAYRLPYEDLDFKENVDDLPFAQKSTSFTSSSSTISKLSNKSSESHQIIRELEREIGYKPLTILSPSADSETESYDLSQYLSNSTRSSRNMNFRVLNRTDEYKKRIQDRINETNNSEFLLSKGSKQIASSRIASKENYLCPFVNQTSETRSPAITNNFCPVTRPSEQGDIGDSDSEAGLTSETYVACGDADIKNCIVRESTNNRVPSLEVSPVGFITNESKEKHTNSQVTVNLNPRKSKLVVKCTGNFEVVPEKTILSTDVTSNESVNIICPSKYTSPSTSSLDSSKTVENLETTNTCKNTALSDKKRIENLIKKNLDLFKLYKSEALKPMKQPIRVLPFPQKKNLKQSMNRWENEKSSSEKLSSLYMKTLNPKTRVNDGDNLKVPLLEDTFSARHQEVSCNSDHHQQKWLDKFRKMNKLLSEEHCLSLPRSTLPRTPPKTKLISFSKPLPMHNMDSSIISQNLGSQVPEQKIGTKSTGDCLHSLTPENRNLGDGGTPNCYLKDSASGPPIIDDQISPTRLKTPELDRIFDKKYKR